MARLKYVEKQPTHEYRYAQCFCFSLIKKNTNQINAKMFSKIQWICSTHVLIFFMSHNFVSVDRIPVLFSTHVLHPYLMQRNSFSLPNRNVYFGMTYTHVATTPGVIQSGIHFSKTFVLDLPLGDMLSMSLHQVSSAVSHGPC